MRNEKNLRFRNGDLSDLNFTCFGNCKVGQSWKLARTFWLKTNPWHKLTDAEFAFGIYDCDGSGKIDAYDIPDVLRSLNLNPTIELCEKMGATKKRGEKKLTVEEFLPIFGQVSVFDDVTNESLLLMSFSFFAGQSSKGPRKLRRFHGMS